MFETFITCVVLLLLATPLLWVLWRDSKACYKRTSAEFSNKRYLCGAIVGTVGIVLCGILLVLPQLRLFTWNTDLQFWLFLVSVILYWSGYEIQNRNITLPSQQEYISPQKEKKSWLKEHAKGVMGFFAVGLLILGFKFGVFTFENNPSDDKPPVEQVTTSTNDPIRDWFESPSMEKAQKAYNEERYEDAARLYGSILDRLEKMHSEYYPADWNKLTILYTSLAQSLNGAGDHEKALKFLNKNMLLCLKQVGPNHVDTAQCYLDIGMVYFTQGKQDIAQENFRKAHTIFLKELGPKHMFTKGATNAIRMSSVLKSVVEPATEPKTNPKKAK